MLVGCSWARTGSVIIFGSRSRTIARVITLQVGGVSRAAGAQCREWGDQRRAGEAASAAGERGNPRHGGSGLVGVEAVFYRVADQVDSVVELELVQGVLDVILDGAVGKEEALGDLLVGQAGADHAEDLGFPVGEAGGG